MTMTYGTDYFHMFEFLLILNELDFVVVTIVLALA